MLTDQRIAALAPTVETIGERSYALDAATPQEQRHPGAGRFIGSGAIEDGLPLAWDLAVARLQLVGGHVERAWDHHGIDVEVDLLAHVHDHDVLAGVEHELELLRRDPRDPQLPQEALALDVLPPDVPGERGGQQHERPATKPRRVVGDDLELAAEEPADGDERPGPDPAAKTGEDQELVDGHPDDARERRRDRAEARDELRDEERARAMPGKDALSAAHARVGLERHAAQHPEDAGAAAP